MYLQDKLIYKNNCSQIGFCFVYFTTLRVVRINFVIRCVTIMTDGLLSEPQTVICCVSRLLLSESEVCSVRNHNLVCPYYCIEVDCLMGRSYQTYKSSNKKSVVSSGSLSMNDKSQDLGPDVSRTSKVKRETWDR